MVGHLFEGVPTDLPRADELLLPMYSFFLRSIVPRTLNELKIIIDHDLMKCLLSPDLASLVVGAPDLATDPRTRRNRLLRRLWSNDCLILIEIRMTKILVMMMIIRQDESAHLRFWRDVEAKKTRVSVVVAALLVLVDLLLKHSQSFTSMLSLLT